MLRFKADWNTLQVLQTSIQTLPELYVQHSHGIILRLFSKVE